MLLNAMQSVLFGCDTSGFSCAGTAASGSSGSAAQGCMGGGSNLMMMLLPLALIVVMLVVMIIPQRRRDKKVKDMLSSLKQGDRVRTIGGIYGTISSVKDDVIVLSVGPDKVKLVFARGAISQVEDTGVENTMTEEVKD